MRGPSPLQIFYGGTFDPIHDGHLAIACAARDELGADIRLMPAADPPHRPAPGADAGQRAEMVALAIAGIDGLVLDRRELQRADAQPQMPSYSIDTLRQIRHEVGPRVPIALLIGADSLIGLPDWREWRALFDLTHFVVAPRPGSPLDGELRPPLQQQLDGRWLGSPTALLASAAGGVYRLHQPLQPESASEVRRRIAAGQGWEQLLPAAVAAYIRQHRLYLTSAQS
ncbi:nicotinate-nucleotide adenylyltransferase [Pseudoxanthomonas dokdonensis]|uniref:Probable nicotinate-nucleotide adenylyltransferase n=1 Tax=Pseudoxanthomonas dokdonensis TaxID=344882 RepID=A0A0R0CVP3_9GAMM|nr:nicotinate-nucleotide adenylyltransferase [Pseudoxanthomonas dokdonensis]KRG69064.1 nicotinate-nucleotide adenylyltransferase [Pseudoxanthomonas dokdonensis]